jgi:hypothetical protein
MTLATTWAVDDTLRSAFPPEANTVWCEVWHKLFLGPGSKRRKLSNFPYAVETFFATPAGVDILRAYPSGVTNPLLLYPVVTNPLLLHLDTREDLIAEYQATRREWSPGRNVIQNMLILREDPPSHGWRHFSLLAAALALYTNQLTVQVYEMDSQGVPRYRESSGLEVFTFGGAILDQGSVEAQSIDLAPGALAVWRIKIPEPLAQAARCSLKIADGKS